MATKLLELTKLPNGDLQLALTPEGRDELPELQAQHPDWGSDDLLLELLEWHLANGWTWLRPEDDRDLTDAPILSDDVEMDDQGNVIAVHSKWGFKVYETVNPVTALLAHGAIVFVTPAHWNG